MDNYNIKEDVSLLEKIGFDVNIIDLKEYFDKWKSFIKKESVKSLVNSLLYTTASFNAKLEKQILSSFLTEHSRAILDLISYSPSKYLQNICSLSAKPASVKNPKVPAFNPKIGISFSMAK